MEKKKTYNIVIGDINSTEGVDSTRDSITVRGQSKRKCARVRYHGTDTFVLLPVFIMFGNWNLNGRCLKILSCLPTSFALTGF